MIGKGDGTKINKDKRARERPYLIWGGYESSDTKRERVEIL